MKRLLFLLLLIIGSKAFGQLQLINVGKTANAGTGDPARTAFIKTNAAITQLNRIGILTITASGAEINILDGALVSTTELNRLVGVTSAVQTQLNAKLNKTDTAAMLSKYLRIADTAGMGGGSSYDTTYLYQIINGKLAISDTASMLNTYAKLSDLTEGGISLSAVQDEIADSLNALRLLVVMVEDTASMLADYINKADTSGMLTRYINKADTASMLLRYINKADTAIMLSKYLKIADTAGLGGGISQAEVSDIVHDSIALYLQNADTGILLADSTGYGEGNYVTRKALMDSLTAAVDVKLSISDTTSMLADYINKADTTTMLSNYALSAEVRKYADTALYFAPSIGVGNAGDTAAFTLNNVIWGVKWGGSRSLVITKVTAVVAGTSPDIDLALLYDVNFKDGTPTTVFSSDMTVTSTTTGSDATINSSNDTIAPDAWLWLRVDEATKKPTQCIINIYGYLE